MLQRSAFAPSIPFVEAGTYSTSINRVFYCLILKLLPCRVAWTVEIIASSFLASSRAEDFWVISAMLSIW